MAVWGGKGNIIRERGGTPKKLWSAKHEFERFMSLESIIAKPKLLS